MKVRKELTARQKTALANHKKKGTHTAKHMTIMKEEMLKGKTFMEAHRIATRKKGKKWQEKKESVYPLVEAKSIRRED